MQRCTLYLWQVEASNIVSQQLRKKTVVEKTVCRARRVRKIEKESPFTEAEGNSWGLGLAYEKRRKLGKNLSQKKNNYHVH